MSRSINSVKRISKKEIYAKYGIEYKAGKIFVPLFGWRRPLLVNGNEKIGKGAWHYSQLPTGRVYKIDIDGVEYEVKGTCPCNCQGCYATKGNYNFKSVIRSLAMKTIIARQYPDFLERAIMAQIEADNIKLLRIHAAGDFFSVEYALMWQRIAIAFPNTVFWTYTKNRDCENIFDGLSNANIVKSIIHGFGFNFGHCDYILKVYRALVSMGKSVYICKCGIDKNQHCTKCHGCATHDYVLFIEHSTEYVAEKDPCFEELKAIIENQATPEEMAA